MSDGAATAVLLVLAGYAGIGALFSAWFVTVGVGRLDPAARGAPVGFRLVIAPGVAALWPVLLVKTARAGRGAHGDAAHGGEA